MARAPSQGADPSTGNKQRARSSLVSWPLSVLPCLAFCLCRGLFWSRVAWSPALSPCFLACPGRGRRVPPPGWEGRRVCFLSFSFDGHRPEYQLFQVSLYVCPSGVPLRARARLSCLFIGFLLLHHCGHWSLCQRALLGFHKGLRGFYISLLVTGRVSQYVLRDYRHPHHDQRDLGGKPCNFSAALALGAFLFRRSFGMDCLKKTPSQSLSCFRCTMRTSRCFGIP